MVPYRVGEGGRKENVKDYEAKDVRKNNVQFEYLGSLDDHNRTIALLRCG